MRNRYYGGSSQQSPGTRDETLSDELYIRRFVRVVKEVDSKSTGLCRAGSNQTAVGLLLYVIFIMQGLIRCRVVVSFVVYRLMVDDRSE